MMYTILWKKPNSSSPSPSWWSCLVPVGDVIDMLRIVFQHLVGTMVKIVAECQFCGFSWQWCSQPYLGSIPAGNLGLSAGILFSGALAAKVLRVLQCMGVATITQRTFSSHQSSILFPSVARVWDKHQRDYDRMAEERREPLVLAGDGRADSPGHCAKYGSYSTIDLEQGIVVDIQLVQVIYIFFLFDKNANNLYHAFLFKDLQL